MAFEGMPANQCALRKVHILDLDLIDNQCSGNRFFPIRHQTFGQL